MTKKQNGNSLILILLATVALVIVLFAVWRIAASKNFAILSSFSNKPTLIEASKEYPEIAKALSEYFDTHNSYPEKLDSLSLGSVGKSLKGDNYIYLPEGSVYKVPGDSFASAKYGPLCNFDIKVRGNDPLGEYTPRLDITADKSKNNRCAEPAVKLATQTAYDTLMALIAESDQDFSSIQQAMSGYYSAKGTYPLQLSDLPLPASTITSSDSSVKYAYYVQANRIGRTGTYDVKTQADYDKTKPCQYVLTLSGKTVPQIMQRGGSCKKY